MKTGRDGSHTLWFTYFFRPRRFIILFIGGILDIGSSLALGLSRNEPFASLGLIALLIFVFAATFLYSEARNLLKRIDKIFSNENNSLKDLFGDERKYYDFVQTVRSRIFTQREFYFVLGTPIVLTALGFYQLFSQTTDLIGLLKGCYLLAYWNIVFTICLSVVWTILGASISLNGLGKNKDELEIVKSIEKFRRIVRSSKTKQTEALDFGSIDFSFGTLKEAISPLADFLFMLAVKIAAFGFLISIPPILDYSFTGDIGNLTYAMSCVFTGSLSLVVFIFAQEGMFKIWNTSKDEALLIYEQLSEHVKQERANAVFSSRNPHAREKLEKDMVFIRSAIDDLKKLEATKFTILSVAKLSGTILLPCVTVIISKLLK